MDGDGKAALTPPTALSTAPWSPPWRVTATSLVCAFWPARAVVHRPGAAGDWPDVAGCKPEDSGLDIGDSAITETYGIGGFAMATAPAIVALVGGTVEEAIDFSRQMREITLGETRTSPFRCCRLWAFQPPSTSPESQQRHSAGYQYRHCPQRRRVLA